MKKIISFALAIMLIATMSVTAFAAETGVGTGDYNVPVSGTYQAGGTAGEKVSVDIIWDSMEFTYTAASQGEWNPDTHSYGTGTAGGWSTNKSNITIKNHSNVEVTATLSWKQNEAITGKTIKGAFDGVVGNKTVNLDDANEAQYQTPVEGVYPAPTQTVEFGIDSTSDAIDQTYENLGTITVTIAKKASN